MILLMKEIQINYVIAIFMMLYILSGFCYGAAKEADDQVLVRLNLLA